MGVTLPGAAGEVKESYEISNSLRFNDGDSAGLAITPSGAGNRKTWTYSGWVKLSSLGTGQQHIFMVNGGNDDTTWVQLRFEDNDFTFSFYNQRAIRTDRKFRDPSAWYHIVVAVDTTQGTDSNRIKLYVNGVQETSFSETNYPSQNSDTGANGTYRHFIGGEGGTSGNASGSFYDGYITEVNLVDGSQLLPTSFGEFDDNGVWIPKRYTGAYGTNGFHLEFKQTGTSANSSGIGADTSGNDNHFTPNNLAATDITEDTCTNNFCTMNPLYSYTGITFSEGNLQTNLGGSNHRWGTGTFFVESGKWYFECKVLSDNNLNSGPGVIAYGIDDPLTTEGGGAGSKAEGWIYLATSNGQLQHGNSTYGTASAATTNDILMVAFDVDNGKIWIGKNGTWSEGSNPSTGNGAVREDLGDASSGLFTPAISGYNENFQFNFGNPPFSISSGNTDGKYGNFEYEVPSGYYALCTKRLAEFG